MTPEPHPRPQPLAGATSARRPLDLLVFRPTLGEGGADRVTLTLLSELSRSGFRPALALVHRSGPWLGELPPDVELHDLGARSLWTAWLPLFRLLRRTRPDILFSTSSGANVVALLAHRLAATGGACVISERNLASERLTTWKRRLLGQLKRLLYRRADACAAVSQAVAEDLVRGFGLPPRSVHVVFNPVVSADLEALAAQPAPHPWLEEAPPLVLAVGRLVEEKGYPTLLAAFARLRAEHPARLLVLGDGVLRARLEALAAELGLADSVAFSGFDPNPFAYMARCDVFALASRVEGLPGVLIQAMACGAAVVTSDFRGVREVVTHGEDGVIVPVGDSERLAAELSRLLADERERRRLGAAARLAAERFRVGKVLPRYEAALLRRPSQFRMRGAA